MKLEDQIKILLRAKAKLELYNKLKESVDSELKLLQAGKDPEHSKLDLEHPGLLAEFCTEVNRFCTKMAERIENPDAHGSEPKPVVKEVGEAPKAKESPKAVPQDTDEPTDPVKFLLKYRHLDSKRVIITTKNGEVSGTVKGLLTPNIVVETDTGYVAHIPPKEIRLEQ